nr:hypothetical protein [Tanacetum cinerariifolium]
MTAILKQFQATPPPASVKVVEEIYVTCGGAHPYYQCLAAGGNTFPELRDNIQGYVATAVVNYNQGNFGYRPPSVANQIRPSGFAQPNVHNNQNRFSQPQGYNRGNNFNQDQSYQAPTQQNQVVPLIILKKLPKKLGDPRKFLILCGFSELKCKALANLAGITRDVFVLVGKFTFLADFIIIDYESDPRVPLILGRPFLWTARALINVHEEEMILHDSDKRLTLNMRHDTSSYSNQPKKELINMINIFNDSREDFLENLFATNHQSGNPTFSSHLELTLLEVKDDVLDPEGGNMFTEEHAFDYSSPPLYDEYDDDLFEVESDTEYDFFEVDALPSTNNEDKVFNPGILIQENLFKVITRVAPDKNEKKLAISHASLILEDFDPPLYELPSFKEVPGAETLLSFSFENKEKVFKPEILTSKGVHYSLILKLSH